LERAELGQMLDGEVLTARGTRDWYIKIIESGHERAILTSGSTKTLINGDLVNCWVDPPGGTTPRCCQWCQRTILAGYPSVDARSILPSDRALFSTVWNAVPRVNLPFIFRENATEVTLVAADWSTISCGPAVFGVKIPEITTDFQSLWAWERK